MSLWDIGARVLTQLTSSSVGLVIKRFSSGASGDLQQWQDETGAILSGINNLGKLAVHSGMDIYIASNAAEFATLSGDANTEFRVYNVGSGVYIFKLSQNNGLVTSVVQPGSLNAYNSLTALKIAGLATASGKPTASTWVAGDTFTDLKGVSQLCTTGGTPGTWVSGGWQLAGFYKFASALATSGAITIAAFDELMIVIRMPSMSAGTDVPALQFNGDTGSNYSYSMMMGSATQATATLTASGAVSQAQANLSGNVGAFQRTITAVISNKLASTKVGSVVAANGSGAAATASVRDVSGQFEWVNTAAQITSVTMKSSGGAVTFPIDSGFQVFGRDFA